MARPLKYGEKTSVRSITMPDTMWEALPQPKSQWVVEATRQMLEPASPKMTALELQALTDEVKRGMYEALDQARRVLDGGVVPSGTGPRGSTEPEEVVGMPKIIWDEKNPLGRKDPEEPDPED